MKRSILFLMLFIPLLIKANLKLEKEVEVNEDFLIDTAEQLDFLHAYNTIQAGYENDWYVVVLGKQKETIANFLNSPFDYLETSTELSLDREALQKINEELKETNKNSKYAAYAFITDNNEKIVIPTVPIEEKRIGNFLTKLEGKLINSSFDTAQDIQNYQQERDVYKNIETKIRNSSNNSNSKIQDIINNIYDKAITFKQSSKPYKLLSYYVNTFLVFRDQNPDSLKKYYVKVLGTQHRMKKGDDPNIDRSEIKDFIKAADLDFSKPANRMLARVSAYRKYIEGEELVVDGLQDGIGKKIYINQIEFATTEGSKQKLIELCNFLTDIYSEQTVGDKYEVIVDYASIEYGKDRKDILTVIAEQDVHTKEDFLKLYPYHGLARQYKEGFNAFRVYFSNTHLWTKTGDLSSDEIIAGNYNTKSVDFLVSNNTPNKDEQLYYYSIDDLVTRYKYVAIGDTNNLITQEILRTERDGVAHSIAQGEYYTQYVELFGTDDAYLFIAFWSAQYAKDLLGPYFLRQIVAEYGGMIAGELLREKATEVLVSMNIEILTQIFINYYFLETTQFNIQNSVNNINKLDVIYSGAKSLIGLSLKQEMFADCFKGALLDAEYNVTGTIDFKNCAYTVGIAILQRYAGNHALSIIKSLKKVAKDKPELFIRGWKEILKDVGADQSQTLRDNLREIFEELGIPQTQKVKDFLDGNTTGGSNTSDTNSNTNSDNDGNGNTNTDGNTNNDTEGSNNTSSGRKVEAEGNTNNSFDNVNTKAKDFLENETEIAVTNNGISDIAKKFWQNHEINITRHLQNKFGSANIGRQITIDIKIKGIKDPITCRVDNLVNVGNGKFRIIDAKSSTKVDLSKVSENSLVSTRSTPNQKKFYKALKESKVESIKPRGLNAEEFFNGSIPNNLKIDNVIDFFVNDTAQEGYNIFKILFTF